MNSLLDGLELADTMSRAPFHEFHARTIDRPIDEVWPACLAMTTREVRALGPLMTIRSFPSRLLRRRDADVDVGAPAPLLDVFVDEGFTLLRRDASPANDRALVLFGAIGKFWSPIGNGPIPVDGPQHFIDFDEPGYAKTTARLEAIDLGDGRTGVETETWVTGTDAASTKKFAPYWALIRLPSGLIRRSWLAGIERRVLR